GLLVATLDDDVLSRCAALDVAWCNPLGTLLLEDPDLVRRLHDDGREVAVWTLDEPAHWASAVALGVDAIITDRPDRLAGWLAARGVGRIAGRRRGRVPGRSPSRARPRSSRAGARVPGRAAHHDRRHVVRHARPPRRRPEPDPDGRVDVAQVARRLAVPRRLGGDERVDVGRAVVLGAARPGGPARA